MFNDHYPPSFPRLYASLRYLEQAVRGGGLRRIILENRSMCFTFCLDSYLMQKKVGETVYLSRICDILNLQNANSRGTQLRQNHLIVIASRKLKSRELARINAWVF